jgi:hypothetical protein
MIVKPPASDSHRWHKYALDARREQRTEDAFDAIVRAATLAPDHSVIATHHAILAYETGRPAAALYAKAARLVPSDMALVTGQARALSVEGQSDTAHALLTDALALRPDWIEGHQCLAAIRQSSGHEGRSLASYAAAVRTVPKMLALRVAWAQALIARKDWNAVDRVIEDAKAGLGSQTLLTTLRLVARAERGDETLSADALDGLRRQPDPGLDLAITRQKLRRGDPSGAVTVASAWIETPNASAFWPYLSIAWRMLDDPQARWLDREAADAKAIALTLPNNALRQLAKTLRLLITSRAPQIEQSVRGGQQTEAPLLFHHDPAIQALRRSIELAIKDYIAAMPAPEASHPFLGRSRQSWGFDGSWSVLLHAGGHHATHTHPRGWISSACHLEIAPYDEEAPQAGWLQFGIPPREIGVSLPHYRSVEPKAGHLVLFPSHLWHGTIPFHSGERLTVAFDVTPL